MSRGHSGEGRVKLEHKGEHAQHQNAKSILTPLPAYTATSYHARRENKHFATQKCSHNTTEKQLAWFSPLSEK